jgi:hypothetical protein
MIKNNILQYIKLHTKLVAKIFYLVKNREVMLVDSHVKELKVELQYTQATLAQAFGSHQWYNYT